MKYRVGDRVICVDPTDDCSGHHHEWVGIKGTITMRIPGKMYPYNIRLDTIPAYYSIMSEDDWWFAEEEIVLENEPLAVDVNVDDLL